ncbi:hypothetical protein BDC45DRAFT_586354 [Circinella umbellata]|nr:hypothetical protein BDC45DRAFT_586354 [Circinella umbellata]
MAYNDYQYLEKIVDDTREAFDKSEYDTVIQKASLILTNLELTTTREQREKLPEGVLENRMKLFKIQAKAWGQKGKYENELEVSRIMIEYVPDDPSGYLIAGHCYKEQGKQEKAIEVFNMGLKQASVMHKEYKALRQGKQEAESRKNKRMDILGQLPLEIIFYIIDHFDKETITPYLHVCLKWHKIILNYPKFWERMSFGNCSSKSEMVLPYYMLLPSICQHVQEIEMFNKSHITTLFKLFLTNNFSKIRSLKVEQTNYWSFENPVSYAALSTALNAVSKTLTTLDLSLEAKSANLPSLSDILNISSNLTTLRYVIEEYNYAVFLPIKITPQHQTMLKELALSSLCEEDTINGTELQKLLNHSPYLSHLAIGNCDETIYRAIQNHGQSINSLYIDHYKLYNEISIKHMWANSHNIVLDTSSPGLKNFSVRNIISPWFLLTFITDHRHTLSFLFFDLRCNTSNHDYDWIKWVDFLSIFPLTKLAHLKLDGLEEDESLAFEDILPGIITAIDDNDYDSSQEISNLQKLELSIEAMIPDNVLDAIPKMPKLTELNFTYCIFDSYDMYELLKTFERRSNINPNLTERTIKPSSPSLSLLSALHFEDVHGLNDAIILTVSNIKSLTRLTINIYDHEDDTVYKTFAQNISKLPLLEWLGLRYINIKKEHLEILATSKSLRCIDIYCIADDFSQKELSQIAKASSNNLVIREIFV